MYIVTIFADATAPCSPSRTTASNYDPAEPAALAVDFFSDAFPGMPR